MSSGGPAYSVPSPASPPAWDDLAILREAHSRALALLESLQAQSRDLDSRAAAGAPEIIFSACRSCASAIEAMTQTIQGIDDAMTHAVRKSNLSSDANPQSDSSRITLPS